MKNLLFFILVQLFIMNNYLLQAQWTQTNGPGTGHIDRLAANDNYIFAYSSSVVYSSTNYGLNWTKNNLYSFNIILIKENNIYAGTNSGIFLSSDGGTNWVKSNIGLTDTNITSIVISEDNIFAGTSKSGVYLSTNNGLSWTKGGLDTIGITSLVSRNNYVFASSAYGVYVTSDIGKNWTQINNGLTNSNIYSLAINKTNIFAFAGNTIYSSTDNGANWSVSLSNSIFCLAANGSNIYAGKWGGSVDNGMYRSTDNGLTWADLGAPGKVEVLAFSGSTIYAGIHDTWYSGYSNLVESQNNGNTWNKIGLPLSNVYALSINGNNLYAGYTDVDISKDSGNHWARINPYGDGLLRVYSMYISEKYTLVCAYDGDRTRIWLNNDTINWQPINGNGIDIDMIASSFVISDSIVFIGISQGRNGPGIYYSTNNGHDWKLSIANISVSSLAINDSEIYAGTTNGVYISSNKGTSWVTANNGLEDLSVTALAISGTNIFAGTAQGGIFYSNDNATTWNKVNNGLTNTNIKCLAISGANIFAGTDGGIFHSNDNGSNWTKIGLDTISILSLAINDTNIFAGTGGYGVWKRLLTDFTTGISQKDKNIPIRFSLSQNYPNPFNPNTVISYSLPSASNIKLSVFNTLGQVVRIIENTFKQSGNYSINFNASNLPSGVYFYRIQAGSYIETKKMMLLK